MKITEARPRTVIAVAFAGAALGACGGGGSEDPFDPGGADGGTSLEGAPGITTLDDDAIGFRTGAVFVLQNLPPDARTVVAASFLGLGVSGVSVPPEEIEGDGCLVGEPIVALDGVGGALQDQTIGNIDAGDALVVSSPGGTLVTLPLIRSSGLVGYTASIDTPAVVGASGEPLRALPEGLVLDIPGGQFPATSVPIPHVEPIEGLEPAPGAIVEAGPRFTWTPSASDRDWMEIALTNDEASITCTATDDSDFSVPRASSGVEEGVTYEWSGGGRVVYVSRQLESRPPVAAGAALVISNVLFDDIVVR